jgi:alpha/beta hydrolase family protein
VDSGRAAVLGWQRTVHETWQQVRSSDVPPPPPKGASPQQHAEYLRTLTDEQLRAVAGRDGLAAELRDQANRMLLNRERDRLRAQIDAAGGPGAFRVRELVQTLGKLDRLAARIGERAPGDDNGYFLLHYDTTGEAPSRDGEVIVALHNPDTAANVATFVPGATTALDGFDGTINRIDALHGAATRAGSPSTSVIAWLDYDAPDLVNVGYDRYATDASAELDSFQDGLRASHLGNPSHNTVVGHSYGALVAGIADRDTTLAVDDLVSAGGTGLGVDHANDLHVAPDHVWATEATGDNASGEDVVADVGRGLGLGRPNAADPNFYGPGLSGQAFESDAPVQLPSGPHSQYFDDTPDHRNPGLENIGDIIAGRRPSH